jgi:hypothetical protein
MAVVRSSVHFSFGRELSLKKMHVGFRRTTTRRHPSSIQTTDGRASCHNNKTRTHNVVGTQYNHHHGIGMQHGAQRASGHGLGGCDLDLMGEHDLLRRMHSQLSLLHVTFSSAGSGSLVLLCGWIHSRCGSGYSSVDIFSTLSR